ncbi:DNA-binding transcriptional activator of the SARP family [Rhizobiales bacterium GAS191]|nr:DNA-binding transcriptional activator of the SARP family [Rhizobiales bacterium GAS113]SEE80118.1 DNA-binding transcriptional activator of the SARP family [Rhizobiales bacterium GAS191]
MKADDLARRGARVLSILVVGAMTMAFGGRDIKPKRRKSQALLAYLALCHGLSETRERLVGLLWSESDEAKAHGSLRQALHDVRQVFEEVGFSGLDTRKLSVALEKRALDVDLWSVIQEAEAFRAHPLLLIVPRLTDTVLGGLEDIDPSFRIWLLAYRQTLQDRLLRALENGMTSEAVDKATRRRLAEAVANLEPTNEIACRALMQARAEAGDTAGALRVYNDLWNLLDEDYDMEPSEQTQRLVADIKTGRFDEPLPATPPSAEQPLQATSSEASPREAPTLRAGVTQPVSKLELAIEAFNVEGIDPDKLHYVQGFHQSLIANLVRFREWYVTDRANQAQAATSKMPAIARYTLRAIAHQSGNRLNLVLTLIEASHNIYVWSDEFELGLDNWFSEQQRIVRRIATSLNVHVSAERLKRLAGDPDVALEVYDQWLRAHSMLSSFSPGGYERAAEISREIIRQAPEFAPGYVILAQIDNIGHIVHPGMFRDREKAKRTLDIARTAVRLDPLDTRAHLCLGWSCGMAGQYGEALVHMDLASELNPNDPWTLISTALFHAFCGQFAPARGLADRALDMTLAPSRTHWVYDATIKFLGGDYAGTLRAADNAADIVWTVPAWRAAALSCLGRRDQAAAEAARFIEGIRRNWSGKAPPSDENIVRWFLHLYPIRHLANWQRLYDGLKGAGLPMADAEFDAW